MPELDELIDGFQDYLKSIKAYSENTILAYATDLMQWQSFLKSSATDYRQVDQKDINSFIVSCNVSKRSQSRKISSIKAFYRHLHREKIIETRLDTKFRMPKYQKKLPKPIRPIDLDRLLEDDSEQHPFIQYRDKALWEVVYSSGMRISEALGLTTDQVETAVQASRLTIQGKGKKDRIVFLGKDAIKIIRQYLPERKTRLETLEKANKDNNDNQENKATNKFFINFRGGCLTRRGAMYVLNHRLAKLGLRSDFSPHSVRHSFATDLIDNGANIREVQEMLGHASISTTQNYVHVARQKLIDTFRKAHPHAKAPHS